MIVGGPNISACIKCTRQEFCRDIFSFVQASFVTAVGLTEAGFYSAKQIGTTVEGLTTAGFYSAKEIGTTVERLAKAGSYSAKKIGATAFATVTIATILFIIVLILQGC